MAGISRVSRAKPSPKNRGGTLLGLFIGLVAGVAVAFAVAWYINKTPVPFLTKPEKPTPEQGAEMRPGMDRAAADAKLKDVKPGPATTAEPQAPIALPGKPGEKVLEKPRFDFYKILPGGEGAAPPPADTKQAAAPPVEQLFLQVGAFHEAADADNLKARLALTGIEASVQQVILPDKGTLHRVRVGPFARPEQMNKVRSVLAQNGIEANVVKAGN